MKFELKESIRTYTGYVLTMKRMLIALCLMVWGSTAGMAQDVTSSLSFRRFTTLDGLPQMQTERVWQDSRGYIWIGTLSGFARYDGEVLVPFLKGRRENIVSFAEVDGGVRALNFRRQWLVDGDKAEMRQIDPKWHWLLNNFNTVDLPNGITILEDDYEKNRRLCRIEKDHLSTYGRRTVRIRPATISIAFDETRHLYTPSTRQDTLRLCCRRYLFRGW